MKKYSLWVFGPAAIAMAIGVLVPPGVSQAKDEWDIGAYDRCIKGAQDRLLADKISPSQYYDELRFCCDMSGGHWTGSNSNHYSGKCEAPPATAQTASQSPGEVVQAPSAGTADPGKNPERTGGGTFEAVPTERAGGGTFEAVPTGPGGPVLFTP